MKTLDCVIPNTALTVSWPGVVGPLRDKDLGGLKKRPGWKLGRERASGGSPFLTGTESSQSQP